MDRKIILASHGRFASGILSSLELICGKQQNIVALDCYLEENFDLSKEINDLMMKTEEKEVIVITDIFGGSVNNEFLRYIEQSNFYLISGLNLSFLIELMTQMGSSEETVAIIKQSLKDSIRSIQFCNESVRRNIIEEDF